MAKFAVLQGSSISNLIIADNVESAELATKLTCIELDENSFVGIGWSYVDGEFMAPAKVEDETEAL